MTKPDTFTQVYLCQKTASCSPGLEQTRPKGGTGPRGGTKNRHTGPRSPGLDCNLAKGRDKDGENITLRLILQKQCGWYLDTSQGQSEETGQQDTSSQGPQSIGNRRDHTEAKGRLWVTPGGDKGTAYRLSGLCGIGWGAGDRGQERFLKEEEGGKDSWSWGIG